MAIGIRPRFVYCRCSLEQCLRLAIAAFRLVVRGQAVQTGGDIGMLGSECFLPYCQCALVKWLCLAVAALILIHVREVVQVVGDIQMLWSECLLQDSHCLLEE